MDVRNCKLCGGLFNFTGNPLCPLCNKKMEEKFAVVKQYIRENPKSSIAMVSEETEVPLQQLKRWIREERLSFSKDSGVVIRCEKCGAAILTGRFCKECKKTMTNSFESLYQSPARSTGEKKSSANARMRFIDKQ